MPERTENNSHFSCWFEDVILSLTVAMAGAQALRRVRPLNDTTPCLKLAITKNAFTSETKWLGIQLKPDSKDGKGGDDDGGFKA
jgi:hypothetical protein